MKKLVVLFIAILSVIAMLFTGCSAVFHTSEAGSVVEKTYDFKDFTGVEISNAIQYEVKRSDSYSVVVSTNQNTIDRLDVHQSGDTLHIGYKLHIGFSQDSVTMVTVTLPQLNKLDVSGSSRGNATGFDSAGNLEINVSGASRLNAVLKAGQTGLYISGSSRATGDLTSTDTQIKLSGASDLYMNLKTGKTGIDASGSSEVAGTLQALDAQFKLEGASDCSLTGSAGNSSIEASGSSKMNSPSLILQSADVTLTGASYAGIHTDGKLNIDISGSSTLEYAGNPIVGKINISGVSKLNHK
jgi:hypothetical protein